MEGPVVAPAEGNSSNSETGLQHALDVLKDIQGGEEHIREQLARSWQRLKTSVVRGGAAGLTLRGGLNVLSTLLFLLRTSGGKKGKPRPKRSLTLSEAVNDTLRYTVFLAALGGSYVAVDEGLAVLLGKSRTAKWRALVAGAVAGHTLLLTGRTQRHHSLATYILLRGLTLLVRTGNKPEWGECHPLAHALLAPTRLQHGDTALMCLASSQIIYSFIVMPSTLPPSYTRFIDKIAGKESYVWHGAREQALRNIRKQPVGPLKALQHTPFKHCTSPKPCEFWHPGQTCSGHAVGILPHAYARALGIYLPVYLVPAVLVHRQKLIQKPLVLLPKVLAGMSRSSLFLATYIALTFGGVCLGFNIFGYSSGMSIATCVWVAGFATLLEKKSRRMELALYCLSRAAESYGRCLVAWGVVSRKSVPARLDVALFAAGCAAITHCYSDDRGKHRDVFRSKYLNVLDFIFGNHGVDLGAIKHQPSNRDMMVKVGKKLRSFSATRLSALSGQHSQSQPPSTAGTPLAPQGSAPDLRLPPQNSNDSQSSHQPSISPKPSNGTAMPPIAYAAAAPPPPPSQATEPVAAAPAPAAGKLDSVDMLHQQLRLPQQLLQQQHPQQQQAAGGHSEHSSIPSTTAYTHSEISHGDIAENAGVSRSLNAHTVPSTTGSPTSAVRSFWQQQEQLLLQHHQQLQPQPQHQPQHQLQLQQQQQQQQQQQHKQRHGTTADAPPVLLPPITAASPFEKPLPAAHSHAAHPQQTCAHSSADPCTPSRHGHEGRMPFLCDGTRVPSSDGPCEDGPCSAQREEGGALKTARRSGELCDGMGTEHASVGCDESARECARAKEGDKGDKGEGEGLQGEGLQGVCVGGRADGVVVGGGLMVCERLQGEQCDGGNGVGLHSLSAGQGGGEGGGLGNGAAGGSAKKGGKKGRKKGGKKG